MKKVIKFCIVCGESKKCLDGCEEIKAIGNRIGYKNLVHLGEQKRIRIVEFKGKKKVILI